MRTTLNIEDDLLVEAKRLAARRGATLTSVVEDALRVEVLRAHDTRPRAPVEFVTFGDPGGELMPGVDLDDNAALLELMDVDLPLDKRR